jgi:hypothetical protein
MRVSIGMYADALHAHDEVSPDIFLQRYTVHTTLLLPVFTGLRFCFLDCMAQRCARRQITGGSCAMHASYKT